MRKIVTLLAALLAAVSAGSQGETAPSKAGKALTIDQEQQREVAVTVYNGNLGLVKDIRDVTLPPGIQEVRFMDVASQINPTTVHLKSLGNGSAIKVLEQNYEYDLLSPQRLMDKYVGKKVKLQVGDGSLIDAVLLSNTQGPIYEINGQIHLGHPGRLILPELPENLMAKPTLVWTLQNRSGRPQTIEASYLTGGMTWKADYVVVLNPKDNGGDINGWVTLDNKSGATFPNAVLKLVAGDVNRAPTRDAMYEALAAPGVAAKRASQESFKEEGFFEYHIYSLQGRTTVKNNQTKQISLLSAAEVPIKKQMIYWGAQQYYRNSFGQPLSNQKVGVYLEIANKEGNNLGLPLPKGVVRVYKADSEGSLQFIGEDTIPHTPKDEKIKIKMGEAFDVVGDRTQKDWKKIGWNVYETEWEIHLRNHKKEDVEVTIIEPVPGDWQVLKTTHPYDKIEAHTLQYVVRIPKEQDVKVTYRVRLTF